MDSKAIQEILMKSMYPTSKDLFITNFKGCGLEECDLLRVTKSNIIYEYEIKISKKDFLNDFKKLYKHNKLKGIFPEKYNEEWYLNNTGTAGRPNYFYYVCPQDLIKESEIPIYSGLIYISDNHMTVIKKAPKLHSLKVTNILIRKIADLLSVRRIFGSSYMNYTIKQNNIKIKNNVK